jgi:energy-coupling factor transporter transmembrane protein EcfT
MILMIVIIIIIFLIIIILILFIFFIIIIIIPFIIIILIIIIFIYAFTYNSINCNNSNYLSKCSLLHINHPIYKLTPLEFIKEFRTEATSSEFIKLVKYYEITNDPYFYDILKKKIIV